MHGVTLKGIPIRLAADFPAETLDARREWVDIQILKDKTLNIQLRILYTAKLSSGNEGIK